MPATVIIPAHDEEVVLRRTLERLLDGLPSEVAVVVVPNGCHDRTAEVAREFEPRVRVLEIERASKTAALNAAETLAPAHPRVYLDADVELSGQGIARLVAALREPDALAAEPSARFDTSGANLLVRVYFEVWQALHAQRPGDVGCGSYALSEPGRARFGCFPNVISDDGFVRAHFAPDEIRRLAEVEAVVRTPRTLSALLKIKTRSRLGALELQRCFPDLWARKRRTGPSLGEKLGRLPLRVYALLPCYLLVQLAIRRRAHKRALELGAYRWERDESSRQE